MILSECQTAQSSRWNRDACFGWLTESQQRARKVKITFKNVIIMIGKYIGLNLVTIHSLQKGFDRNSNLKLFLVSVVYPHYVVRNNLSHFHKKMKGNMVHLGSLGHFESFLELPEFFFELKPNSKVIKTVTDKVTLFLISCDLIQV